MKAQTSQTSTTTGQIIPIPGPILTMLAERGMREHHYLFHQLRNQWDSLDSDTQAAIADLGWQPPRPAIDANGDYITDNNSGEDFLYMHHSMIAEFNTMLAAGNYSYGTKVVGWNPIPGPNDTTYPVPPITFFMDDATTEFMQNIKSDDYYTNTIVPLEQMFTDPSYLTTVTLGQLGSLIEVLIHNPMHVRWTAYISSFRPDPNPFYDVSQVSTQWDVTSYSWMNDFYSSHCNPIFWKIHGWVDNRIYDWLKANNIKTYTWKGTWMGPMPAASGMTMFAQVTSKEATESRHQVLSLLAKSGKLETTLSQMKKRNKK